MAAMLDLEEVPGDGNNLTFTNSEQLTINELVCSDQLKVWEIIAS